MTIFYLIRHGEKKGGPGDVGLSESGKIQAERTARYFKKLPIAKIYSSPYARAKETAKIISHELNLDVIEENSLRERMNWETTNQTFDEFLKEWEYASHHPNFKPHLGDSVKETATRMKNIMGNLSVGNNNNHIILVTHGGAIQDFLVTVSKEFKILFTKGKIESMKECSVTKIVYGVKGIIVEYFDNIDHLG